MSFSARYHGKCAGDCGETIKPGDVVSYVDEQLVHDGCEPAPVAPDRAPRAQCPECFTETAVNGACACPA